MLSSLFFCRRTFCIFVLWRIFGFVRQLSDHRALELIRIKAFHTLHTIPTQGGTPQEFALTILHSQIKLLIRRFTLVGIVKVEV